MSLSALFILPSVLAGFFIAIDRKRFAKRMRAYRLIVALLFLARTVGLGACGGSSAGSSGNNGNAAPGTSTVAVTVTGADNTSHSINLNITVE